MNSTEAGQPLGLGSSEGLGAVSEERCRCRRCITERGDAVNGLPRLMSEFIVCPTCGDKRCVHAKDHRAPCAKDDIYEHNLWVERTLLFAPPEAPNV